MSNFDKKNCDVNELGTGLLNCILELGYPKGFVKLNKNFSAPVSTEIDLAYFQDKVQAGDFVPFLGADNNELPIPEDVTQEVANGRTFTARDGKRMMTFGYLVGDYYLNKIMNSHKSNNFGQVALVFENDSVLMVQSKDGLTVKGFEVGMFSPNYQFFDGSVSSETKAAMQLLLPDEFNKQGVIYEVAGINKLRGANETELTILTAASGGAVITASATFLFNRSINVEGLTDNEFKVTINGVEDDIVSVAFADGVYTITATTSFAADDVVVVSLYDQTEDFTIVEVAGDFYEGTSKSFVVV